MSKKKAILTDLFKRFQTTKNPNFNNDLVKEISTSFGFRNHNDVTKIDRSELLPSLVRDAGYCIAHLGDGKHRFVKAVDVWYHTFESINEDEERDWDYKPSLLNHTDTSESNIISTVFNQRMLQKFLYDDISANPRIYLSRRTKINTKYRVKGVPIDATKLQMEIDATFELDGSITVLEGKNGVFHDFAVYQIFHPYLYYLRYIPNANGINCCYLVQDQSDSLRKIRFYLYTFRNSDDIESIRLLRKAEYRFKPALVLKESV